MGVLLGVDQVEDFGLSNAGNGRLSAKSGNDLSVTLALDLDPSLPGFALRVM